MAAPVRGRGWQQEVSDPSPSTHVRVFRVVLHPATAAGGMRQEGTAGDKWLGGVYPASASPAVREKLVPCVRDSLLRLLEGYRDLPAGSCTTQTCKNSQAYRSAEICLIEK